MASPQQDAQILKQAMKGLGTDDETVINVICNRTNEQLVFLNQEYKKMFGKTLRKAIKSETSGDYRDVLLGLIMPRPQWIAKQIHAAVDRAGTDEGCLIDLLVFSPRHVLDAANHFYEKKYKHSIAHAVGDDTSGDFKKALLKLIQSNRDVPEGPPQAAAADAHMLYKAGEGKIGTDEKVFIEILCGRPLRHTFNVANAYKQERGKKLAKVIKSETSGYFAKTLLATTTTWPVYWAKRVRHAVKGVGTKDALLKRCFVFNDKASLKMIAHAYHEKYNRSMFEDVKADTSFNYQKTLTQLLK